ncbi:MAG: DUF1343 domain-containing protein, partial [Gammaproteobacteria bacterium]|nr:DUF1343 domain-containing protein [Gammaproteobacteria bacterium]
PRCRCGRPSPSASNCAGSCTASASTRSWRSSRWWTRRESFGSTSCPCPGSRRHRTCRVLSSCLLFGATVILESTNLSEGRGTTRPFELLGAPFIDGARLASELHRRKLPGLLCRPASFVPTFSKHDGVVCGGVQLHVTDRMVFDPPRVGLHVLDACRRLWPDEVAIRTGSLTARYHTPAVGEALLAGAEPEEIVAGWAMETAAWRRAVRAAGIGPEWWAKG